MLTIKQLKFILLFLVYLIYLNDDESNISNLIYDHKSNLLRITAYTIVDKQFVE